LQWQTAMHSKSSFGTACSAIAAIKFKAHGSAAPPKPVPEEKNSRIRTADWNMNLTADFVHEVCGTQNILFCGGASQGQASPPPVLQPQLWNPHGPAVG
jgi:hypothetical protein